ncbi:MAG: type II secretion system inner membrane protein GspF [Deltaproteobacteria bacterium]|nr:type II secretion system inner membrane protein GspF [Deltaproteobacteria bacterium]
MSVYEYMALNKAGKNVNGIIDADSSVAARQKLRGMGIYPIEVTETLTEQKEQASRSTSVSLFFKRVKPGELSAITRQLSILLGAGITLVASMDALLSQISNPILKKIMAQVKEAVNEGNSFAFALSQHPRVFSQIYVNMVRAGEASGSLDLVLDRLAEFSENQQALKARFKAALAYPVLMSIIGTLILFVLITFIVPNITKIFSDMHQSLPLPTLILIGLSSFLKSFWWLLFIVLIGSIVLIRKLIKTPKGRYIWDGLKLRSPVIGPISIKMSMSRFGRTLGSLLQSGVILLPALKIVRNIVSNTLITEVIDNAMEEIEKGKSLAAPLSGSRWFPPIAVQMISVGEQSGELEKMLNKIADIYERETESEIMALTSMLEPVMILGMGLVVGFIVISILLPIFEMNQMIR